jgi:pimeloyl-ACP methyl ester carboxylesterase
VPLLSAGESAPGPGRAVQPFSPGMVKIAYRHFGSGPDLVLVMGEHGTMTWWDPQLLSDLASSFTVTTLDLPGVGYSAPLPGGASLSGYADALAGLVDSLQLTSPVVLGWGLGGAVALSFAERHRPMLSRLVLVDTPIGGTGYVPGAPSALAALASSSQSLVGLARLMFSDDQATLRATWLQRVVQVPPDDIVASAIDSEAAIVAGLPGAGGLAAGLHLLRIPALLFTGGVDRVVPRANTDRIAQQLRGSRVVVAPGAGYGALVQSETLLVSSLESFVAATPLPGPTGASGASGGA